MIDLATLQPNKSGRFKHFTNTEPLTEDEAEQGRQLPVSALFATDNVVESSALLISISSS